MANRTPVPWAGRIPEWWLEYESRLEAGIREKVAGIPIDVRISRKLTRTAGFCRAFVLGRGYRIDLAAFMNVDEAKETFGHEYAHFLAHVLYGPQRARRREGHTWEWMQVMRMLGLNPTHRYFRRPRDYAAERESREFFERWRRRNMAEQIGGFLPEPGSREDRLLREGREM